MLNGNLPAKLAATFISLFLLFTVDARGQSAHDKLLIGKAKIFIDQSACDSAVAALSAMSDSGRQQGAYYRTMARAYECKGNKEYALIYYYKAIDAGAERDSMMVAIERLKPYCKGLLPDSIRHGGHHRVTNVDYGYLLISGGYSSILASGKSLYHHGVNVSLTGGMPFMQSDFVIEGAARLGAVYYDRKGWNKYATVNTTDSRPGPGIELGAEAAINYMIIDDKRRTLMAGITPGVIVLAGDKDLETKESDFSKVSFIAGIKVSYLSKWWCAGVQYSALGTGTVPVTYGASNITRQLYSFLRFTAGIKLSTW